MRTLISINSKAFLSFLMLVLSFSMSFSQQFDNLFQDKTHRIKTNLFIIPSIQQWNVSLEFKPLNSKSRVNCIEVSRNLQIERNTLKNPDERKSISLTFRKIFYTEPIFKKNYLFASPYLRLKYRDVYQKEVETDNWFDSPPKFRDFTSTSIIGGASVGEQTIFNKISIGFSCGLGLGYVLGAKVRSKNGAGEKFHLDGDLLVQFGFIF